MSRVLLALLLSSTVLLGPSLAEAQAVALAPFAGRRTAPIRRLVRRALSSTELVSQRRTARAARSAGLDGTSTTGVSELAEALEVEIVVQGEVSGPRRRQQLVLVFRAADGTELARTEAEYRRGRAGRRAITSATEETLASAQARLSELNAQPVEPVDTEPLASESSGSGGPTAPADAGPPPEIPDDGLALLSFGALGALRTRDVDIGLNDGRRRRYGSGPYGEVGLGLEVRPFTNDAHLGRGLFFRGAFAHSVGLSTVIEGADEEIVTNFLHFNVDAGWLAPIGEVVELGLGIGVSYDGYFFSDNDVLPSAELLGIRPGARARFRLAQEALVFEAELAYRGVVRMGPIRNALGEDGETHGVDVGLGLGGNLLTVMDLGFTWGVRFDWVGYFYTFAGDANFADGESGTDNALRFTLLLGWSIR